ncbi:hypothetical protein B9Z47_14745 [Limnohabitans sp. 2KL-1]|jgi:uncharacterized membrane protein YgdD (TMEM256/DUF423 family)|nr:hypothetical protein B9Z47_14745 [Limnohabitans sp. 2KL-1]
MGLPFVGFDSSLCPQWPEKALMQVKNRARSRASMRFVFFQPGASPDMTAFSTLSLSVSARIFLSLGALSACTSVVFSAAFAHLPVFAGGVPTAVQTALSQQQFHSLGLLITGLVVWVCGCSRWWLAAGWLMLAGLLLFSFNLYARHVLGFDALRVAVPWGGAAWILAWLSLGAGFISRRGSKTGAA